MWRIGNAEIPNRVVVAPMAGISNTAFRVAVEGSGTGLVVCGVISDKGIKLKNKKTLEMLYTDKREYPLSVQISGGDKEILMEATKFMKENTQAAVIGINMGCLANKIIKTEAGAKWLLDPNKMYKMVHIVSSVVSLPVTIKMRTGWDEGHLYTVDSTLTAEQVGASAITMHGRTHVWMCEGTANWDVLEEVKRHLTIPFMGNGDVKTPRDTEHMLEYVGADGVMIGRAALGSPWVVQRAKEYLEVGELIPEPSPAKKTNIAKAHLQRLVDLKGEKIAVRELHQHASYYLKEISRTAKVKIAINQVEAQQAVVDLLDAFIEKISKAAVITIEE